jgi:prepilin-type N-terminal cleavage/methylation domain-containing protein
MARSGRHAEQGFSLLEMLVAVAILTIVLGVVFHQINNAQVRYGAEESKVDLAQEARSGLDTITRDLHQSGYPTRNMFDSSLSLTADDARGAKGLTNGVQDTDLQFEGDVDGDGTVNVIHYKLLDDGSGNCPCTLVRSQIAKGTTPEVFSPVVQNVVNSSSTGPLPISGSSSSSGGLVSNDTLYAAYKKPAIFQAFDKDGNAWDGAKVSDIRTIRITLNVLAPNASLDTGMRPAVSMTMNARVGNNN